MADHSAIEWTETTWNPVTGCTKVSPGCAHCYIERTMPFRMNGRRFVNGTTGVMLHEDRIGQPLRWRDARLVFVNSLSDLFHDEIPDDFRRRVFDVMMATPQHTYQVLTKRPDEALSFLTSYYDHETPWGAWTEDPLPNVWIGVSIESSRYTWRADVLREMPAAVRFISAEPLLGSLFDSSRLSRAARGRGPLDLTAIDWLIAGGESGPGYRTVSLEWLRELRDACERDDVAFFFKQWGGKTAKAGGRELDERIHDEMPLASTG